MTVATRVSCASAPRSFRASARIAMIWSPSTSLPAASTARQRSASPSRAMPRSAPAATTASLRCVEVGRAVAVVDVEAVGLAADDGDLGAGLAEGLAARPREAAPWAASMTTCSPSSRCGQAVEQVGDVAVGAVGERRDAADVRPGRALPVVAQPAPRSGPRASSASLWPPAGEELDAVVGHRVVRRGEHDAEVGVLLGHEVGDRRASAARRRRARRRRPRRGPPWSRRRGTPRRPGGRDRRPPRGGDR